MSKISFMFGKDGTGMRFWGRGYDDFPDFQGSILTVLESRNIELIFPNHSTIAAVQCCWTLRGLNE